MTSTIPEPGRRGAYLGETWVPRGVVVTGAASGIGRATVELFAERGVGVVAVDHDERTLCCAPEAAGPSW
ncbi:SDR family NAD(P)-dependent oxidoreductase [Streptosporangium sp. NPDC051022]|uniref:SDR family NAD(P)-dependent oxidoreductase n=1 Tax=Streptosporangium sp. NPDC051022 TaxID=3155752 RepID=UPI003427560F